MSWQKGLTAPFLAVDCGTAATVLMRRSFTYIDSLFLVPATETLKPK